MSTQTLQVQAPTLEAARQDLQKKLTLGIVVIQETILTDGSSKKVDAEGTTVEDAVQKATAKLPDKAIVENEHVKQGPTRETIQVTAFEESEARRKAAVTRPRRIEAVSMTESGRKGFLGIGRRPNTYDLLITQPAAITITYRELASICAEVGTVLDKYKQQLPRLSDAECAATIRGTNSAESAAILQALKSYSGKVQLQTLLAGIEHLATGQKSSRRLAMEFLVAKDSMPSMAHKIAYELRERALHEDEMIMPLSGIVDEFRKTPAWGKRRAQSALEFARTFFETLPRGRDEFEERYTYFSRSGSLVTDKAEETTTNELSDFQWWNHWWEWDMSWEGLSKCSPEQYDYWRRDPTTSEVRDDATLESAGELLRAPDGTLWHIVNLPPTWLDGTPTWKIDLTHPEWNRLEALLHARLDCAHEIRREHDGTTNGLNNHLQLSGAVLRSAPTYPQGHENPLHVTAYWTMFLGDVDFSCQTFGPDAHFNSVRFGSDARFESTCFLGKTSFSGATFAKDVYFQRAKFFEETSFYGARFGGVACFENVSFLGMASFSDNIFAGKALFKNACFDQETYIYDSKFADEAEFQNTKFSAKTLFTDNHFAETATFANARFTRGVAFNKTFFSRRAYFGHARFAGETSSFMNVRFGADTLFGGATFAFETLFNEASFTGLAAFNDCSFARSPCFRGATFSAVANFDNAKFAEDLRFADVGFEADVWLRNAKFTVGTTLVGGRIDQDGRYIAEARTSSSSISDNDMVQKLVELAEYYARGGRAASNPSLVEEVKEIGRTLNRHGGITEMRRVFAMVPEMRGKRTVEMEWDGIGDWRG